MSIVEEIKIRFEEFNIFVDDKVLNKCYELCKKYNITSEDFCDIWYAYTASHLNGQAPTIEFLERLERKEFHKKEQSFSKSKHEDLQEIRNPVELENAALTPQSKRPDSTFTPTSKTPIPTSKTPVSGNTPVNKSISTNSSKKFLQRVDSRSVQRYYGSTTAKFKRELDVFLTVKEVEEHKVPTNRAYMFQILKKKAKYMNNKMYNLGCDILEENKLDLTPGLLFNQMGDMVTYGRILSDADSTINAQSILLEGSDETNRNNTVRFNVSKLSNYSLIPGQVVVAKGVNVKNHSFVVHQLYTKAKLELPEEPPIRTSSLQIVVAAGPFTLHENRSYEPLHDLIKYVANHKPNVLILMGPFLDENNETIFDMTQSYDLFFQELIENLIESLQQFDVHVIIVPSQNDVHHHPIYPTPPYYVKGKFNNVMFISDPGVVDINGIRIMSTTADTLSHIENYELHYDRDSVINSGKHERLISHIFNQKNIYPLYPHPEDISIDNVLLEHYGTLKYKPHILILPSSLKSFVKEVDDCLVINPERLTTGFEAGTFARIEIEPGSSRSLCGKATVQVLKV